MTLGKRIKTDLKAKGKTAYWLAKATGLNMGTVYAIIHDRRDPLASTVALIDRAIAAA